MSIRVVIIHNHKKKGHIIEDICNADKNITARGVYRKSKGAMKYIMDADLDLVILSELLDTTTAYQFIVELMKSKPIACLILTEAGSDIEVDYPRALDYSIVDTYIVEYDDDGMIFPIRMLIKVKILSKLNIDKFRSQINQINNYTPTAYSERKEQQNDITGKVKVIRNRTSIEKIRQTKTGVTAIQRKRWYDSIVVIGASTGGPRMLVYIISQLPREFPPVLIVQHMPKGFVGQFATRMNDNSQINVKKAEDGDKILPGNVYIAPGGYHMEIEKSGNDKIIKITDGPKVNFVKPSVDVTLFSAARVYQDNVISVILTGMGSDGREGSRIIKKQGGNILALNEQDSVIYGMNKSVIEAGLADNIAGMDDIVPTLGYYLNR